MRKEFLIAAIAIPVFALICSWFVSAALWSFIVIIPLLLFGFYDYFQVKHTIRRNFPLVGRFRYWLELIRPEINQYFIESNTDGSPFNREERSVVYQRAKNQLDTLPFGTQRDVYQVGYEWVNHSLQPVHPDPAKLRIDVGGPDCKQIYSTSILNVSAMSYGSLSGNAVLALNKGAKEGNFAHNTGEGGISPYHLKHRGDLIWQIGTGYFGCRTEDGVFCPDNFRKNAIRPEVKMIEIKLSQGAKPGHGGILPASKVTPEIAEIRGVPLGKDILSPPAHTAFETPLELAQFIGQLRELSGAKPIGFKLCVGKRREFLAIGKALIETGVLPDFITVDGGEGGTGAAPLEFSNRIGTPGVEGLIFVHSALSGFGIRDKIRVFATGKVVAGFSTLKLLALGADATYSARAMMMAIGCIQALRCNNNTCPTGVATQDPHLTAGLDVEDKSTRVRQFHEQTVESVAHMLGAMGMQHPSELRPWHIMRRVAQNEIRHYGELYDYLEPGALLESPVPQNYQRAMNACSANTFRYQEK